MKTKFIFAVLLLTCKVPAQTRQEIRTEPGTNIVTDSVVSKKVLKAVTLHVKAVTRNQKRALVVKDGRKSRRFIVREILGMVSLKKNTYIVQLDADEFDHKIPRILYVDVRLTKGAYKVTKIRIGPNRFRN